jgi:hypothetical protein
MNQIVILVYPEGERTQTRLLKVGQVQELDGKMNFYDPIPYRRYKETLIKQFESLQEKKRMSTWLTTKHWPPFCSVCSWPSCWQLTI